MTRKTKIASAIGATAAFFLPALAFAQGVQSTCGNIRNLTGVFNCAIGLVGYFIALTFILAVFFFLWGIVVYIKDYEKEASRTESRQFMIYGIIALFVMVSVWGLVGILENTFGLGSGVPSFGGGATSFSTSPTANDFANSAANLVPPGSNQAVY